MTPNPGAERDAHGREPSGLGGDPALAAELAWIEALLSGPEREALHRALADRPAGTARPAAGVLTALARALVAEGGGVDGVGVLDGEAAARGTPTEEGNP